MRIDVLTLFPEIFHGYLTQSLLKLALDKGLVQIHLWNIRDWAQGKHHSVDDRPFGGGPGMVIMPEPVYAAVEAVRSQDAEPGLLVLLSPCGRRLTQPLVQRWPSSAACCYCVAVMRALTSASVKDCGPLSCRSAILCATAARCRPWW